MMHALLAELTGGLPDAAQFVRLATRIVVAALLGAVVGTERERAGKDAGLRTHMLVAVGAALFVVACLDVGMASTEVSRVIQGLAAGVGFLGAGAILKPGDERQAKGLTTAAGIWMTAAVGVAAGLGRHGLALVAVVLAWLILAAGRDLERRIDDKPRRKRQDDGEGSARAAP
jgi:putative Mg2+ transporter-C (MgtC) family protein